VTGERKRTTEERKAGRVRRRRQYKPPRDRWPEKAPAAAGSSLTQQQLLPTSKPVAAVLFHDAEPACKT
jgi:hypothetical protein